MEPLDSENYVDLGIQNLEKILENVNNEYAELYKRVTFMKSKNKNLIDRKIEDKILLLTSGLNNIFNTLEKINYTIDDSFANKGTIGDVIQDADINIHRHHKKKIIFFEKLN